MGEVANSDKLNDVIDTFEAQRKADRKAALLDTERQTLKHVVASDNAPRATLLPEDSGLQWSFVSANVGSQNPVFAETIAMTLQRGCGDNNADYAAAVLDELKPRDGFEAMLVSQMAMTQRHIMLASKRMGSADTLDALMAYERMFTKLTRTFTAQMEAIRKHRNGGKQIVEHVHVNEGGQAIIAKTVTGGSNET